MAKIIISCAVTGSAHVPSMSDALPFAPRDIVDQAVEAAEAGAAILHMHARDPEDGRPTGSPDAYELTLPLIKQRCDAVINITTGGSVTMALEDRLAAARKFKPEMCSLNMGSMNFCLAPAADRIKNWKFDWEEPFLRATKGGIFRNTFADIEEIIATLKPHGTRFELECYDVSHLYNLAWFADKGLIEPPFFPQMIFGIMGGIGADLRNLVFMKETADHLLGSENYQWSCLAAGKHQMSFLTQAALMGGNVRVGLEDSLFLERGKMAASNAEQVRKIVRILKEMGHEPATPAEAREMLQLKGGDRTEY